MMGDDTAPPGFLYQHVSKHVERFPTEATNILTLTGKLSALEFAKEYSSIADPVPLNLKSRSSHKLRSMAQLNYLFR